MELNEVEISQSYDHNFGLWVISVKYVPTGTVTKLFKTTKLLESDFESFINENEDSIKDE